MEYFQNSVLSVTVEWYRFKEMGGAF